MAIRNIRTIGDPVLNKKCKEVKEMTPRIQELIKDRHSDKTQLRQGDCV